MEGSNNENLSVQCVRAGSNSDVNSEQHGKKTQDGGDKGTARKSVPSGKGRPPSAEQNESLPLFILRWTCLVLTVAASIVFGIWAPLSYTATVDANRDDNAAQSSVNDVGRTANRIAGDALSTAVRQHTELEKVHSRIAAVGQLILADFCMSRTTLSACSSFFGDLNFDGLVSSIASMPTATSRGLSSTALLTTPGPSRTDYNSFTETSSPLAPDNAHSSGGGGLSISVGAILGIVFGVVGLAGVVAGVFVWRLQQQRQQSARERSDGSLI